MAQGMILRMKRVDLPLFFDFLKGVYFLSKALPIAQRVRALIEEPITQAGYLLWDVSFAKEGPDDTLFVLIDSPCGIGLSDCEKVTRLIDPILDEADPIEGSYYLEVSSTGSERVLKTPEHFAACMGQTVVASLYRPVDGQKELIGELKSYEDGVLTIGETALEKGAYSTVKTVDTTSL